MESAQAAYFGTKKKTTPQKQPCYQRYPKRSANTRCAFDMHSIAVGVSAMRIPCLAQEKTHVYLVYEVNVKDPHVNFPTKPGAKQSPIPPVSHSPPDTQDRHPIYPHVYISHQAARKKRLRPLFSQACRCDGSPLTLRLTRADRSGIEASLPIRPPYFEASLPMRRL